MEENNQPPPGMTEEEWNAHLAFEKKWNEKKQHEFETELKLNPPKPPWLVYPEHQEHDMFWRMGEGQTHLETIVAYFQFANENEIIQYKSNFPETKEWQGFYSNLTKN